MQGQKVSGHQIGPTKPDRTLFFLILLTCEVYLIEVLGTVAQMRQYIIFLKLETNKGEFRLYS